MADRVVDFLFGVVSGGFDLFCPSLSRIRFRGVCERCFSVFYLGVGVGDTLVRRLSAFAERFVAVVSCPGRLCDFLFWRSIHVEIGDVAGDAVDVEESFEERR